MDAVEEDVLTLPVFDEVPPRLHPFTIEFCHPRLEQAYRHFHTPSVMPTTRLGFLLVILLYVVFGIADLWLVPELLPVTWPLRGAGVLFVGTLLAFSWSDTFIRHQQGITLAAVLILAVHVALLFAIVPGEAEDQHFISLFLLIVGSYAMLSLQFPYTMLVGVVAIALYAIVDLAVKQYAPTTTLLNLAFLVSAVIVTGAGARTADRQRRLAYFGRLYAERQRERIRRDSLHDPLTGLANRRLLVEKLAHALARDDRFKTATAVLFMDMDDFKHINDTYGHVFGDQLLVMIGERLVSCVRTTDTVARLGGDEFVVLLEDLANDARVEDTAERIHAAFGAPCVIDGITVNVDLSIGWALHPRDAESPDALLEHADKAMYRVKRERKEAADGG